VRVRKVRTAYRMLVGTPQGKSNLEDQRIDGRIMLQRREEGGEDVDCIELAKTRVHWQGFLVNALIYLSVL
jgi:hypothetical protein